MKGDTPASLVEAEKKGRSWDEFVENDLDGYQTCREQANAEQQGVCAYTELPLDVNKVTVHFDHYRCQGTGQWHQNSICQGTGQWQFCSYLFLPQRRPKDYYNI